jgi:hypothetical protein
MNREEIHHGDTETQSHKRSVLFLCASVPLWWKPGSSSGVGAGAVLTGLEPGEAGGDYDYD